jgi:hypothetical protein
LVETVNCAIETFPLKNGVKNAKDLEALLIEMEPIGGIDCAGVGTDAKTAAEM